MKNKIRFSKFFLLLRKYRKKLIEKKKLKKQYEKIKIEKISL